MVQFAMWCEGQKVTGQTASGRRGLGETRKERKDGVGSQEEEKERREGKVDSWAAQTSRVAVRLALFNF